MNAYHRLDPNMDEKKSHYSPDQLGAFVKVQLVSMRQANPGRFRSIDHCKNALPAPYARHVPFLVKEGDLVVLEDGAVYVDGIDEWQKGDLNVAERMRRLRQRKRNEPPEPKPAVTPQDRNGERNEHRNEAVTPPVTPPVTPTVTPRARHGVGVGTDVTESDNPPSGQPAPRARRSLAGSVGVIQDRVKPSARAFDPTDEERAVVAKVQERSQRTQTGMAISEARELLGFGSSIGAGGVLAAIDRKADGCIAAGYPVPASPARYTDAVRDTVQQRVDGTGGGR